MKRFVRIAVAATLVAAGILAARATVRSIAVRREMTEGQQALDRRDFRLAAARFRSALDRDPRSTAVRLSLAAAYAGGYVPGGESPGNLALARQAFDEYRRILERDPGNRMAVRGTAALYDGDGNYDEARTWYRRAVALDPADADALARLSTTASRQVAEAVLDARARAGLAPDDRGPIADTSLAAELRTRWSATIDDGIADATRALSLDPAHDGALAAMSAWHRLKADVAGSIDAWQQETRAADDWMRKALAARKVESDRARTLHAASSEAVR